MLLIRWNKSVCGCLFTCRFGTGYKPSLASVGHAIAIKSALETIQIKGFLSSLADALCHNKGV